MEKHCMITGCRYAVEAQVFSDFIPANSHMYWVMGPCDMCRTHADALGDALTEVRWSDGTAEQRRKAGVRKPFNVAKDTA
jgi:hypothetical protein